MADAVCAQGLIKADLKLACLQIISLSCTHEPTNNSKNALADKSGSFYKCLSVKFGASDCVHWKNL